MNPVLNQALDRIEHLVSRAKLMERNGDTDLSEFLLGEARSLAEAMDNDDDEVFVMRYHRYCSDSFGIEFEITHGDPELMFGGVV